MANEAITDLPSAPETPSEAKAVPRTPGVVTLSNGDKITLRRLNGLDMAQMEQAMYEAGFRQNDGPGSNTYYRCCAAFAIVDKNGQLQAPPTTPDALRIILSSYYEDDWGKLVIEWLKMTRGADFRSPSTGA